MKPLRGSYVPSSGATGVGRSAARIDGGSQTSRSLSRNLMMSSHAMNLASPRRLNMEPSWSTGPRRAMTPHATRVISAISVRPRPTNAQTKATSRLLQMHPELPGHLEYRSSGRASLAAWTLSPSTIFAHGPSSLSVKLALLARRVLSASSPPYRTAAIRER